MCLVFVFKFFSQYYPELFPPRNITVMLTQSGTHKVHVSLYFFDNDEKRVCVSSPQNSIT